MTARLILFLCLYLIGFPLLLSEEKPKTSYTLDNIAQFITPISAPLIGLANIKSKHPFRERVAVTVTALVVDEIVVQTLKHTIHSRRPDNTDDHSFPSGHTSLSFAGAEIIREEYGWLLGGVAYGWSVLVGGLRIVHHRHRFIDVVGGALSGFSSARLAYLLLPIEKKLFKWEQKNYSLSIVPFGNKDKVGCQILLSF